MKKRSQSIPPPKVAARAPVHQDRSKLQQGLAFHQAGNLAQAQVMYEEILNSQPKNFDALHLLGVIYSQKKQYDKAVALIGKAIALYPGNPTFYSNLGVALSEVKRFAAAVATYDRAIALKPDYVDAHFNRGNALTALKQFAAAVASYDRAIAVQPDYAQAHYNRGVALKELRQLDAAVASYDRAIALKPDYAEAHSNRGNALTELQQRDAAVASYDRAIALKPDYAEAHSNRGNALVQLGKLDAALASYDRAIALRPDYTEAHSNRGNALAQLRQLDAALASYDRAIAIKPDYADAHYNRGNALAELKRLDAAVASYDRAIAIKADYAQAYFNRGNVLQELRQMDAAVASYRRAIAIQPDIDYLLGALLHARMMLCDWQGIEKDILELLTKIEKNERVAPSFAVLGLTASASLQRQAATIFANHKYPADFSLGSIVKRPNSDKLRIGYFSADFHDHATMHLMAGLLEEHDKDRFELIGFSFGPEQEDEMRQRVSAAFRQFIDVSRQTDKEIAALARKWEIDIAVDLKGYTQDHRAGIFSFRAAPIQVSYLGYPGTMGSGCMDYLIADQTLIPPRSQAHYSEKTVYLPNSYQVNDAKRKIADKFLTRHELGLPEVGFIFCCFNSSYKITPATFDGWMRIVHRVEGSVLWLLEGNPNVRSNLRKEARARGVSEDRLLFAARLPSAEHLARHRVADLFLDTLPCNAHTTASDALWAGLPVLTCMGESFASRVAASLLHAIRLPELVTENQADYEALAIELAINRGKLSAIKEKLAANRLATPLFDTPLFTRRIESAYQQMYERSQADLPPDYLYIAP